MMTSFKAQAGLCSISSIEPFRLGSLEIGQTRLEIKIEDDLVDDFFEQLNKKTLRAGA